MTHGMIIDLLTIAVMAVAAYYAMKLNRSLMRARDGRAELTHLIASLTDAQSRAESSIQSMKVTAADYELSLSKQIAISRGLVEELAMINDTSNALATRMERLAPHLRAATDAHRPTEPEPARSAGPLAAPADLKASRSRFADEWAAQPAQPATAIAKPVQPAAAPAPQAKAQSVAAQAPAAASSAETQPRSRAERELFAAIETLRKGGKS